MAIQDVLNTRSNTGGYRNSVRTGFAEFLISSSLEVELLSMFSVYAKDFFLSLVFEDESISRNQYRWSMGLDKEQEALSNRLVELGVLISKYPEAVQGKRKLDDLPSYFTEPYYVVEETTDEFVKFVIQNHLTLDEFESLVDSKHLELINKQSSYSLGTIKGTLTTRQSLFGSGDDGRNFIFVNDGLIARLNSWLDESKSRDEIEHFLRNVHLSSNKWELQEG